MPAVAVLHEISPRLCVVTALCSACGRASCPLPAADAADLSSAFAGYGWNVRPHMALCPNCREGQRRIMLPKKHHV